MEEALSLDPVHAEAKAALARCRADKAAAEARRQSAQGQVKTPVVAKPKNSRRAVMVIIAVGLIKILTWQINSHNGGGSSSPPQSSADSGSSAANPQGSVQPPAASGEANAPDTKAYEPAKKQDSQAVIERKSAADLYGMEFVAIPSAEFMMGCSPGDGQCDDDENPRHQVTISAGFELGKYEVTEGQWVKVMGSNPSYFKGDDRLPVENVNWDDVQQFAAKLNALHDGYRYRLPTEAEWEYAARGGTAWPYYGDLDAIAWYDSNAEGKTHAVGLKQPNRYGLYDMLGNVWELCADWYSDSYYASSTASDSGGPSSGQHRVLRGGSWYNNSKETRASFRSWSKAAEDRASNFGFRLCRERL